MELNRLFLFHQPVIFKVALVFLSLIVFYSCKDEPLNVGKNVLPPEEILDVEVKELSVNLHTVDMEPVYTRSRGASPVGSFNDPLFGVVSAEFVTDFTFYSGFGFRGGIDPDTVSYLDLELVVKFSTDYANNTEIDFNVYQLTEPIPNYSFSDFEIDPGIYNPVKLNLSSPEIENEVLTDINGNDSITDKILGYRVFLSDDFGKSLITPEIINDSAYYSDSIFRSLFYGFYFEVEDRSNEGGGLITVNHTDTRLILRTSEKTKDDTTNIVENSYILASPEYAGTSINMYRSQNSTTINSVLNDTVNDQEFAYIQSLVGPKIAISIPGLFEKRRELNYKASVSKAELILPIDSFTYDNKLFRPPYYLGIRDVANDTNIIDDGLINGYFGGTLDTVNLEYRFNMGNYIHYFLRDSINSMDERLYLFGGSYIPMPGYYADVTYFSLTTPGRVVLNSGTATRQPRLRIIYSKLP